ncbi:hypothetical protein DFP72DRAFT_970861, partial [Ephemerocybe angulata]
MAPKTAWSASSSLPSDRIPSRTVTPKPTQPQRKKGAQQQNNGLPMSPRVAELSRLVHALKYASLADPDPKGGCFCQARVHGLSPYAPICIGIASGSSTNGNAIGCGLVICAMNSPAHSCPSCFSPLLSPVQRDDLVKKLEEEIDETLAKEEEERIRKEEERRAAVGAFPTLAGGPSGSTPPVEVKTSHKVLSLTGGSAAKGVSGSKKKGKVTIATYTTPTPSPFSTPPPPDANNKEEETRVPPPVGAVPAEGVRDPRRPFRNLRVEGEWYVHPPQVPRTREDGGGGGGGEGGE